MKLPFSYKRSGWSPSLLISLASHAVLMLGASLAPTPAEYAVEAGLNSVEVMITTEMAPPKPLELPSEEVMALEAAAPVETTVPRETLHKKSQFRDAESEPPATVSDQGAQQEAKPDHLANQAPRYPLIARLRGWEGVVVLRVSVRSNGTVGQIELQQSSGHDILDETALRTVHGWRFLPTKLGGMSLSSWVAIPVRFRLIDGQE